MQKARLYLDNGFLEIDNDTIALGGKTWTFVGSEGGGKVMAIAYTVIETAKRSQVNPQGWLTWVLARIADHKFTHIHGLLPWDFKDLGCNI